MKHIIRNSDVQLFLQCRQKWDFTSPLRRGHKPLVPAEELDYGTAWHEAMERFYQPQRSGDEASTLETFLAANRRQQALAATYGRDPNERPSEKDPSLVEQVALGNGMLEYYFEWAKLHDDFDSIRVENEFEVPIINEYGEPVHCGMSRSIQCSEHPYPMLLSNGDSAWVFQGRVDGIFKRNDGTYWLAEHKTAKNETDWSWHVIEPQTLRYMWALKYHLHIDFRGVIRTEAFKRYPKPPTKLLKGGISIDKKQPTTSKLFLQALAEEGIQLDGKYLEYLRFLQSPEATTFIRREYVDFTDDMMAEAGDNLFRIARDMLNDPTIYPSPSVFNCKKCAFFTPCLVRQERGDFEHALKTMFN